MSFRIRFGNGLILGSGDYQLEPPVQGLETPEIRNGSGNYAGTDGGYFVSQLYGMRTITLKGFYGGCASELRRELLQRLYMRYYSPIVIEDFARDYWFTQAYVTDIKADLTSPKFGEFQITLTCPDPLLYRAESWQSTEPVSLRTALSAGQETTILRQGDSIAYPRFVLAGQKTDLEILINGERFALEGALTDTTIIDMKTRQVYSEDGTSLADMRTTDSKWLYLGDGANTIQVNAEDLSGVNWAMFYSPGYRGI